MIATQQRIEWPSHWFWSRFRWYRHWKGGHWEEWRFIYDCGRVVICCWLRFPACTEGTDLAPIGGSPRRLRCERRVVAG